MHERELLAVIYWTVARWATGHPGRAQRALDPDVVDELIAHVRATVGEPDRARAEAMVVDHIRRVNRSHSRRAGYASPRPAP